ncbi:cytidine deaminase family protein [Micromonospora echinofusca]|uniref:Cytidine deaminase n=1 Tax=Micromonospora echinofusca TaxID=47858 RepID=A0ABS3VWP9_MICEH|nr:cytidine deaminase [Micromonospora echinofusca]MBO4208962.1 cytidine deaminase [Micromonospora echinofusca]
MQDTDRALVQAASAVARLRCRSARHTVAAAALTSDGRVVTGVNVRHDGGAVCAELVVLGTAATQGAGALATIVAVADRGRSIPPPCADCRRVLLDAFPDIRVIVGTGTGTEPTVLPLADLPTGTP